MADDNSGFIIQPLEEKGQEADRLPLPGPVAFDVVLIRPMRVGERTNPHTLEEGTVVCRMICDKGFSPDMIASGIGRWATTRAAKD